MPGFGGLLVFTLTQELGMGSKLTCDVGDS